MVIAEMDSAVHTRVLARYEDTQWWSIRYKGSATGKQVNSWQQDAQVAQTE